METHEKNLKKKPSLQRIIGIAFIIPPCFGVIFFVLNVYIINVGTIPKFGELESNWKKNENRDGEGFMSTASVYMGLMAIAGAMLLKDSEKN